MKEYLTNLWTKLKAKSVLFKTFMSFLVILYFGLIAICVIPVKVDSTVPGTISNVSRFIGIDTKNQVGNIYTVSIYSQPNMSVLQYLFTKMDRNSEIFLGEAVTYQIFTENEEYESNVGYKQQSINDSIIVAYNRAIKEGRDVVLDYKYNGEYLIHIPQNLLKTGAEDFKNGDVVKKYNGLELTKAEDLNNALAEIFSTVMFNEQSIKELVLNNKIYFPKSGENNETNDNTLVNGYDLINSLKGKKTDKIFTVSRTEGSNKVEKDINPCLEMLFYLYTHIIVDKENKAWSVGDNRFSDFNINYDLCKPQIHIKKMQTVGPSGGLMQALAVYNAITEEDICKGWRVMGTGGITLDGTATPIGGEQQKVVTADLFDAHIFFIPKENYDSAKIMHDKKKLDFPLVAVSSLDDVIEHLKGLEKR